MQNRSLSPQSRASRAVLATLCACAALIGSARAVSLGAVAQVPGAPGATGAPEQDAAQQEMRELFAKVERRLREIDKLLSDAGAGDTAKLEKVGASGIDELLKHTRERQREVVEGIDRILELARQFPQQSESGGSGNPQQQQQGESPLDKQGEQSTQREETPARPQSGTDRAGQKPEPKKDPSGDTPLDPRADRDKDPKNAPGKGPPTQPTDPAQRPADDKDRWGDLPVHARDVFRIEGGGDMPVQYRDWIDAYYRRLNKTP